MHIVHCLGVVAQSVEIENLHVPISIFKETWAETDINKIGTWFNTGTKSNLAPLP